MSEFGWVFTAFSALTIAALFVAGVVFLRGEISKSEIVEAGDFQYLNKRPAVRLIEQCLKGGKEYITADFLDDFQKDFDKTSPDKNKICTVCGFCSKNIEIGVKVEDLERSKIWNFGYTDIADVLKKTEIFTNIKSAGNVYVGKIYIEFEQKAV